MKREAKNLFLYLTDNKQLLDKVEQNIVSRWIICRSRRLKQIIDLRDTDKSQYFAITEFNNCFIIRSLSFFKINNIFGKRLARAAFQE